MKKKYLFLIAISSFFTVLDQLVKIIVHTSYHHGESTPVIENIFHITYVRNYGAAFGFLAESHPVFREIFFLIMPPVAMIMIFFLLKSTKETEKWQIIALSSIMGGAIGNYIDRLRFRYVIDYLDFHYYDKWSYPAFNIADMAIVGGVCLLILLYFIESRELKKIQQGQQVTS